MKQSTAPGHEGRFLFGTLAGQKAAAFSGTVTAPAQ